MMNDKVRNRDTSRATTGCGISRQDKSTRQSVPFEEHDEREDARLEKQDQETHTSREEYRQNYSQMKR